MVAKDLHIPRPSAIVFMASIATLSAVHAIAPSILTASVFWNKINTRNDPVKLQARVLDFRRARRVAWHGGPGDPSQTRE